MNTHTNIISHNKITPYNYSHKQKDSINISAQILKVNRDHTLSPLQAVIKTRGSNFMGKRDTNTYNIRVYGHGIYFLLCRSIVKSGNF